MRTIAEIAKAKREERARAAQPLTPPTVEDVTLAKQMDKSPTLLRIASQVELTPYVARFGAGRQLGSAPLIHALTGGGEEMILFALQMMRGELTATYQKEDGTQYTVPLEIGAKDREWAADYLSNRMWGKSPETVNVKTEQTGPKIDYSKLSVEELQTLRGLMLKAKEAQTVEGTVTSSDS